MLNPAVLEAYFMPSSIQYYKIPSFTTTKFTHTFK